MRLSNNKMPIIFTGNQNEAHYRTYFKKCGVKYD